MSHRKNPIVVIGSAGTVLWLAICLLVLFSESSFCRENVTVLGRTVDAAGEKIQVNVVKVSLESVQLKVGLAHDRVGPTENLADIAARHRAIAAINGSFFDAYTSNTIKNPHHTVIIDGRIAHIGNVGTLCWFTPSNEVRMERLQFSIEGSINGSYRYPQRWFAYWLNRYPTADTTTIYTPLWGTSTGLSDGVQVVVSGGVVKKIAHRAPQQIPPDGYVIYFRNMYNRLHQKFQRGDRVEYRITIKNNAGRDFWSTLYEGLGAGPLLVRGGKIVLDPLSEGFSSPKITSLSCARSAIGLTDDRSLLMVTTSGTMRQLAEIMLSLGCTTAMNLDGGASSSLWCRGKYITPPGREISNALLVVDKKPATAATPFSSSPPSPALQSPSPMAPATPTTPVISPSVTVVNGPSMGEGGAGLYLIVAIGIAVIILAVFLLLVLSRKKVTSDERGDDEGAPDDFSF